MRVAPPGCKIVDPPEQGLLPKTSSSGDLQTLKLTNGNIEVKVMSVFVRSNHEQCSRSNTSITSYIKIAKGLSAFTKFKNLKQTQNIDQNSALNCGLDFSFCSKFLTKLHLQDMDQASAFTLYQTNKLGPSTYLLSLMSHQPESQNSTFCLALGMIFFRWTPPQTS